MTDKLTMAAWEDHVSNPFWLVQVRVARPLQWDRNRLDFNACATLGVWFADRDYAVRQIKAHIAAFIPEALTGALKNGAIVPVYDIKPDQSAGDALWAQLRRLGCSPFGVHRLY